MHQPDPILPPLLTGHPVASPARDLDEACRRAAAGEIGAGDLVWGRDTARASCTLVLEPEVVLATALQMAPLGLVAAGETLGHLCPPQVAVEFRWPGVILVNGAVGGEVVLAAPPCARDDIPRWLALSVRIDVRRADQRREPGHDLERTVLAEEGAGDITRSQVIEALAARLLAWIDTWSEDGFRPIHDQWLFRADGRDRDVTIAGHSGRVLGLDEEAGLLLKPVSGKTVALPYVPHMPRSHGPP